MIEQSCIYLIMYAHSKDRHKHTCHYAQHNAITNKVYTTTSSIRSICSNSSTPQINSEIVKGLLQIP
jgi:hypothetical protein